MAWRARVDGAVDALAKGQATPDLLEVCEDQRGSRMLGKLCHEDVSAAGVLLGALGAHVQRLARPARLPP